MDKDAYYFSHDANAHHDPKIIKLRQKHGWSGYGIYWALVELLRNESDYKLTANYSLYAYALQTDEKCIKEVVEDFDLFVVENGNFYSASLLKRMEWKEAKSQKAREAADIRWKKKRKNKKVMRPQCQRIAKAMH